MNLENSIKHYLTLIGPLLPGVGDGNDDSVRNMSTGAMQISLHSLLSVKTQKTVGNFHMTI